ncbi:hypothetical protein GJ744_007008 [Endocarpon pusillum]|uniref:Inner centromere protein ARK-binding domain-containing protein n=1 Tax=Endocarpon pusillum TaxID=364733 RepID=A0A8H7AMI0_9EURO|nr:hypothetical protein GJ744_007008 [Endocarpon pusillum]
MAARTQMAVGSASWINAERENVKHLLEQEKEELIYPAQHEMEWLNEHMAEIFSKSHFNVTDVFKTPGKLRGKTPRTVRKRNAVEPRVPLSDVFSSKPLTVSSPKGIPKPDRSIAAFAIAQDGQERRVPESAPILPKHYTDSGYHGSTEDETERDIPSPVPSRNTSPPQHVIEDEPPKHVVHEHAGPASAERRTTEGSFHSAREDMIAKVSFVVPEQQPNEADAREQEPHLIAKPGLEANLEHLQETTTRPVAETGRRPDLAQELDDIGSPSDGSTPDRPLVRKSSLTFASLPAREPLLHKKSFGARESRTSHLDQSRIGRSSYFGKLHGGSHLPSIELQPKDHLDLVMGDADGDNEANQVVSDFAAAPPDGKTSTQRLHEKIDMLGKSQPSRLSKSIPTAVALAASNLRQSEAARKAEMESSAGQTALETGFDEDDDWIKPLGTAEDMERPILTKSHTTDIMENIVNGKAEDEDVEMEYDLRAPELIAHEERMRTPVRMSPSPGKALPGFGHVKSASTATLASPGKATMAAGPAHVKTISVSNPPNPSTTPKGSPRRMFDAPLTASKSKLQSIMKTAKGLFTSSAGASAAAKMETLSPKALEIVASNMPGLYPSIAGMLEDKPLPPSPPNEGRRTRSSTERAKEEKKRERELRGRQKAEDQLEKAREKEKQSAAQFKAEAKMAQAQTSDALQPIRKSPRRPAEDHAEAEQSNDNHDMPPPAVPSVQSKAQRPAKPSRDLPKKSRPQPMSIRVASQRMPVTTSSLASNLQETLPPPNAKPNVASKKVSNASLNAAASNVGFKSSVTSQAGKPRALLAAERKKEADERETQRKLEQKRETERKRAAQQEEARRQEQRQRAEAERKERERVAAEQAKKSAQQQAIDKRRQEQARKMEQQRIASAASAAGEAGDASSICPTGPSAPQRHEMGASRPPSKLGATSTLNRSLVSHNLPTNPAKPPKRPHEDEAGPGRAQAPKFGAASQQADAKRRRTEDEETVEPIARPTMSGAPIRHSNMSKKPGIFSHGYAPAPPGPHMNQGQSQSQMNQFPPPPNPHRIVHPSEMSKYANGNKIPFADAPNPPAYPHHHHHHHHKTPSSTQPFPHQAQPVKSTLQPVKSSPMHQPHYTPGETIALPEIPTDSEDSASDASPANGGGGTTANGFPIPSWASPTTLTNQLIAQESIDGDAVFGPIAPLRMEEIFTKGNKDRLKRFRERTSSANWATSGDGLTVEEVRADREMRARIRGEGGWRFEG